MQCNQCKLNYTISWKSLSHTLQKLAKIVNSDKQRDTYLSSDRYLKLSGLNTEGTKRHKVWEENALK